MWSDGYESSNPLKFTISQNFEINQIFSETLSAKSASLIKMISTAYGNNVWRSGFLVGSFILQLFF
jgi:aminopeptidase N